MASESGGYVVLGGGIAGVTCAETLSILCPEERILLITSSNLIKAVTNLQKITKTLEVFDVKEKPHSVLENRFPNIKVIHGSIVNINPELKEVSLSDNSTIGYSSLCVCTGGTPKLINKENTYVLGIRDTESVKVFQEKLQNASRIAVVGNGGIATELV
ncbi:pyridine nucleotide-disulfide oxidoreductase domain-containing protein 1-like, partial [Saccoglossus kowalevskii]|uniref:Pyridine nucleotide-disulfide oxidoreductase domain-containing protein 1-like n=1 Tax=Saccoglossus kowalevskii TaxID=10224 RepID=A0ABM0GXX1_SACKO